MERALLGVGPDGRVAVKERDHRCCCSCAHAASGHAAAPPSVAKNFRRPMWLAM
jgi:hypothetical protein